MEVTIKATNSRSAKKLQNCLDAPHRNRVVEKVYLLTHFISFRTQLLSQRRELIIFSALLLILIVPIRCASLKLKSTVILDGNNVSIDMVMITCFTKVNE